MDSGKTPQYRYLISVVIFGSCMLVFNSLSSIAQNLSYGLEFNSFEVVQEKRTGLDLSPSKDFSFPDGFSLSFNTFFYSTPEYNFGYVFRITGQNNRHLDFLVTPEKLTVVNSDDKVLADASISEISKNFSSFFPFQLDLDIKNNSLKITIGEKVFSPKVSSLKYFKKAGIIFGKCDYPQFQTSDVPKMVIKDIRINDMKRDSIYYWKLSKHTEGGVYDELKNHFAKVENPKWLLDNHVFWNKRTEFKTLKNPQITYNSNENVIAIADKKKFYVYNTFSNELSRYENSAGFVHSEQPNQLIYNPADSTYYSYCFSNITGRDVSAYDFSNKSWNNNDIKEVDSEFWHHNKFISSKDDCLYTFGGYGQHRYKNQVNRYSFKTGKWESLQLKGEQIPPRYLSGLGVIDENRLLLFGGYGSSSGEQFLSPKNYYNLYQINLPDLSVKKIWEMKPPKDQFVVANSMIVDTVNKCFYALCFPQNQYETSLLLTKFSLQKPEYEVVSDSIPFYFNDILSYVDLFQNKKTGELYVITFSSLPTDSLVTVSIYSMAYLPMLQNAIYQNVKKGMGERDLRFLIIAICTALIFLAIFTYLFLRKKKNKLKIEQNISSTKTDKKELKIVNQTKEQDKKQGIYLFGRFQVKDKEGADITGEFSPMLRQLFLIILLNTFKEGGKGISSAELDETFWSNKTHDSARNNRSVMISKLRQLFENVGQINIEIVNYYWIVKLNDNIYCDYREAILFIQELKQNNNRTKEEVIKLLNIVSYGELLPNLQAEWVDPFKANFANDLIDLLIDATKRQEFSFSPSELIYLADTLFLYDVLNDDALKLKCRSLVQIGKNGLAQTTYSSFVKQYAVLFGTEYSHSFAQIIA